MTISPINLLTILPSPRTGIFSLTDKITRQLPTSTNDITHETIHPSVLRQKQILPQLQANIDKDPALICGLLPLEEELRKNWPYVPGKYPPQDVKTEEGPAKADATPKSLLDMAINKGTELGQHALHEITHKEVMRN